MTNYGTLLACLGSRKQQANQVVPSTDSKRQFKEARKQGELLGRRLESLFSLNLKKRVVRLTELQETTKIATSSDLVEATMSNTRIGLVRCEHCGRQFNAHSGARHIPWCEKQQNENRKHRLSAEKKQALERYKWRISYRPTNQLNSSNQQRQMQMQMQMQKQERRFSNLAANINSTNRFKKSSINSSATLSSPSAGSTTSIGTSVTSNNSNSSFQRQKSHLESRANVRQQQQRRAAQSVNLTQAAQLKRSISSLTLTKRQGALSGPTTTNKSSNLNTRTSTKSSFGQQIGWQRARPELLPDSGCGGSSRRESSGQSGKSDATFARSDQNRPRTKSVNDLSNMSEIVETLAKRMNAIYAQNQALLASLSRGNLSKQEQLERPILSTDDEDDGLNNHSGKGSRELTLDQQDTLADQVEHGQLKCHHCKSSCLEKANYCHKCGCKVYRTTATTINTTATSSLESGA